MPLKHPANAKVYALQTQLAACITDGFTSVDERPPRAPAKLVKPMLDLGHRVLKLLACSLILLAWKSVTAELLRPRQK